MITAKEANTGLARLVKRHKGETGPLKIHGQIQLILPELKVPEWLPPGEYELTVSSPDGKVELYKNRIKIEAPAPEPQPEPEDEYAYGDSSEMIQMRLLNQLEKNHEAAQARDRLFYEMLQKNSDQAAEARLKIEQEARERERQHYDEIIKMQREESRRIIEEVRQQKSLPGVVERDNTHALLETILPILKEKGPDVIDALVQLAARRAMAAGGAETGATFADLVDEATEAAAAGGKG